MQEILTKVMAMIPHPHQTGMMNLGICKHVLIYFNRERPLQLRLRTIIKFVTKFVKIYTNLYHFLWVLLVFKCCFIIFTLTWLFYKIYSERSKESKNSPFVLANIVKSVVYIKSFGLINTLLTHFIHHFPY